MNVPRRFRVRGRARGARSRWLAVVLLTSPVAGACDDPFEPFQEATRGPFSMFGYLDLAADTQWIRVTPVRQNLLADPSPVDAVVTLERLPGGRTVTLRDSIFEFIDARVGGVGYAHNFWTAERLERGATYRLVAARSDGATTTALIEMPAQAELSVSYAEESPFVTRNGDPFRDPVRIDVHGAHLLYSDLIFTVWDLGRNLPDELVLPRTPGRTDRGAHEFAFPDTLRGRPVLDLRRLEARFGVAPAGWPFEPGLAAAEAVLPGRAPSNVENGFGFVGGVATWSIPLPRCHPREPRPDGRPVCAHTVGAGSASVLGRVVGACSGPRGLPVVSLTQRFPDGGMAEFEWKAGWDGSYAFRGLEPGAELFLEGVGSVGRLPALAAGERFVVPDVFAPIGCGGTPSLSPG
jgi:hypothetical protein